MGISAIQRLLQKIQEKKNSLHTIQKIVLPGKLVLRGSHRVLQATDAVTTA
jgi:DNA-binding LacI/PurR family transcriptional regulator